MRKKAVKKILSVTIATIFAASCIVTAGCGEANKDVSKETESTGVIKPTKIEISVHSSMLQDSNDEEAFEKYMESLLSAYGDAGEIHFDVVGPNDSRYYEGSASSISDPWEPDVICLSYEYYKLYANAGMLWNMTEAWENSDVKNSGRLSDSADEEIDGLYVYGEDGKKALYGISPVMSSGSCTYVKADWLERAGIDKKSIQGNKEGIINKNAEKLSEEDACEYFCTPDPMRETGVITYRAGRWTDTFSTSLQGKKRTDGTTMSGELVVLEPIAELGAYVKSKPYVWCIVNDHENPEGLFKYFIESMLDGSDIQMAWQYGVKGTNWDDNTEDFTFNYIETLFAIAPVNNDPGLDKIPSVVKNNLEFYNSNSVKDETAPYTDEYGSNIADINNKRKKIISKIAIDPSYSAEQGVKDYEAAVGHLVKEVIDSMNKYKE